MKKLLGLFALGLCALSAVGLSSCNKKTETIKVYTRDTDSGTREGFFEGIGFGEVKKANDGLVEGYITVASNGDMITGVKGDEYGIGYISLSSLETSGVKGLSYENVSPTEENVINGSYKLTRNFNYCLRETYAKEENKQIVEAFVAYMSTIEGKATIKSKGGILSVSSSDKSWDDIKSNYEIVSKDNSSVTINIGGSTSVNSIVKALLVEFSAKCGNFKYVHNATGSSDAYKRTNGSEKDGVNACDLSFASREFNQDEKMADSLKGKMCTDAIVAVVNNNNKLDGVTAETLKNIYKGVYTSWDQVK